MRKDRLKGTRDYFNNITQISYNQFMNREITILTVYSMATGLYHITDWLIVHDLEKVKSKFGNDIDTGYKLWRRVVERNIPLAGYIRDLNNAAKHVELKDNPSTSAVCADNTFIQFTGFGEGGWGEGPYGGGAEARIDGGEHEVKLEPIATEVFQFWKDLVDEFHPPDDVTQQ